jgi:hypothetical protein
MKCIKGLDWKSKNALEWERAQRAAEKGLEEVEGDSEGASSL